jgi:hypothetical protein
MPRSFAMLSADAARKLAMRTRQQFMAGQMSHDEFRLRRARQEVVAHNRFETLLARAYPSHKPDLIEVDFDAVGHVLAVRGASLNEGAGR